MDKVIAHLMDNIATKKNQRAWAETFRYAKKYSPYYHELFRNVNGVPPLNEVPTVDKILLSKRNLDFLCVPRERVVEIVTTSGTTGMPLLWMLTEADARRLALNEKISFECAGLTARDTVLVAVALDRCFVAGLAYTTGLRELGCAVVRVGASSATLVLETIERVQPTIIVAVPSFLRHVADKARETKFDLKKSFIKKAVCIGEPIRDGAFELNASGRAIETAWGAKVFSTYGVTELANSLCECDAGAGGHLHDKQLHIEILNDDGQPVADGDIGEVVATTFGVEAMPLIRYRTGDCAALFSKICRCGRKTPRIGPIVGRKNQKLKFKGASLFPSTLASVLEEIKSVEAFVIIARKENELSDSIEVLIDGTAKIEMLRDALQARAKIAPQVRHATREEIESLQLPPQARKRRNFVDLR
ncbi:MAG TPA: AMP-binding protein [Candidatus Dormibacteraeota bacterium]|nr:AMP-binding protein [Candidatus Dormibacteraeota bacterium]